MANTIGLLITALMVLAAGCGAPAEPPPGFQEAGDDPTQDVSLTPEPSSGSPEPSIAAADEPAIRLIAVGDMADCTVRTDRKVANLAEGMRGKIATLGDNAYPDGSEANFSQCFDPLWDTMTRRMFPSVGNHEYRTPDAKGYFDYFAEKGRDVGERGKGWYAYDLGTSWRAISLNSNCWAVGGCTKDSPQGQWLADELAAANDRNVIAYWHAPRYSSGSHGSTLAMKPFFRMLWRARADIVLSGHDHAYERFAPQNATGDYRPRGVQQFTVGTGGRSLYAFEGPRLENTRARNDDTYGVLKLRLRSDSYSWRFVRAAGGDFTDSGSRTLR